MDKEKLINAMAKADFEREHPEREWELLSIAQKTDYKDAARVMLKALCKELPELTKKESMSGFVEQLVITDAPKLYNQLRQWGKDD